VGLAFKLAQALLRAERQSPASGVAGRTGTLTEDDLLDLVAVGTVADVVPLTGENRALVHRGLAALRQPARLGLRTLLEVAEIPAARLTAGTLGWSVAPRLNAAGRMDDADAALALLLARDPDEARRLAQELETRNVTRRELTATAVAEAESEVSDPLPLLLVHRSTTTPIGVLGLVAGRLVDRFYRPAVAIRVEDGLARASLRSIAEFHVADALDRAGDLLDQYGGHALAAGFTTSADRLDDVLDRLRAAADESLGPLDLRRQIRVDAEVGPEALDWALHAALEELKPFGEGNPRPVLCIRNAPVSVPKVVGSGHLRFQVEAGVKRGRIGAIAFGEGDRIDELGERADVVATLRTGEWAGERYLELKVVDFAAVSGG
jgi:single-stranded-DNA-specific exonuclease